MSLLLAGCSLTANFDRALIDAGMDAGMDAGDGALEGERRSPMVRHAMKPAFVRVIFVSMACVVRPPVRESVRCAMRRMPWAFVARLQRIRRVAAWRLKRVAVRRASIRRAMSRTAAGVTRRVWMTRSAIREAARPIATTV